MKYIKLFFISIIVFGMMLFCISLLFPSRTVVSRAVNVGRKKDSLKPNMLQLYTTAFRDNSIRQQTQNAEDSIQSIEGEFISSNHKTVFGDTLLHTAPFAANIKQGIALYEVGDSTAVQVFYQIHVPVYQFWNKFALMLNEAKYGPSLDSAVSRISRTL